MQLLWLALGLALLWSNSSEAACISNGGGVWTVSALNATEMRACITAASSGDTIHVPSGSASWKIDLPANKDLNVVGATNVVCSGEPGTAGYSCAASGPATTITGSPAFAVNLAASHTISGFVLTGGEGERISSDGEQNPNKHFRIHHNVLISTTGWEPIRFYGESNGVHPQGIWDHNRFQDGVAIHTNGTSYQLNEGDQQHILWTQNPQLGASDNRIFVEDNYFVNTKGGTINYADGNYGARSVIRFNTIDGPSIAGFEFHSPQGDNRGYQRWETYENHFVDLDTTNDCYFGMLFIRGGTGVAFGNDMSGSLSGCNFSILLDNVRSEDNVTIFGRCDGTRTGIDQNVSGQQGWHCRDQIGVSHDNSRWDHLPSPLAYNQAFSPAYLWGNTRSGSVITGDVIGQNQAHIQANRDYYDHSTATGSTQTVGVRTGPIANRPSGCTVGVAYWATDEGEWNSSNGSSPDGRLYKCTASNTWTLFYTPYAYPHPWAGGAEIPRPGAPMSLSVI